MPDGPQRSGVIVAGVSTSAPAGAHGAIAAVAGQVVPLAVKGSIIIGAAVAAALVLLFVLLRLDDR